MIVLMTNRAINGVDDFKEPLRNLPVSKLGDSLSGSGTGFGIVSSDRSSVNLFPESKAADFFDDLAGKVNASPPGSPLRRPWLVFVHGFNQDIQKNLDKAHELDRAGGRNVNVIAFSWPSRPDPGKSGSALSKIMKRVTKSKIRSGLGAAAVSLLIDEIEDYWKSYTKARANARDGADQLHRCVNLLQTRFINALDFDINMSLIVHSLGNYLTENAIRRNGGFRCGFNNVIVHQADADMDGHTEWVDVLSRSSEQTYVTINKYDSVLAVSQVYNRDGRIGQSQRHGVMSNNNRIKYVDFTGISARPCDTYSDGEGLALNENDHEMFLLARKWSADSMYDLLGRLLSSQRSGLHEKFGKDQAGFVRTNRKVRYYQPVDMVDDFDDCVHPLG